MYFRITKSALDSGGREYLPQSVLIQCRHICTACSVFLVLHIFGRKTSVSKKIYQVHLCTRNTVFNITIYSVLLSFLGVVFGCFFFNFGFFLFFFSVEIQKVRIFTISVVRKPTRFEFTFLQIYETAS